MAERVFLLNTLRPEASRADYERFVREVDYPVGRSLEGIDGFEVVRLEGSLEGEGAAPFDYIEVVDIAGLEEYFGVLKLPEVEEMSNEWRTHVEESIVVHGEVIE